MDATDPQFTEWFMLLAAGEGDYNSCQKIMEGYFKYYAGCSYTTNSYLWINSIMLLRYFFLMHKSL